MPGNQPPFINPVLSYADAEYLLDGGGEYCFHKHSNMGNSGSPASGQMRGGGFVCKRTETLNTITFFSGTTAQTAATVQKYAIFERSLLGDVYTQIGVTANDLTLLAVANTRFPKQTLAPFTKVQGREYAVVSLTVTGGNMPTYLSCSSGNTAAGNEWMRSPARMIILPGQADIPASFLFTALTSSSASFLPQACMENT